MSDSNRTLGRLNRRQLLKSLGICAAGGAAGLHTMLQTRRASAQTADDPRFLIVLAGGGGASLVDSFLAIRESEAGGAASTINAYPDAMVASIANSPFRAVANSGDSVGAIPYPFATDQAPFVNKHKDELMVVTQTGTSVNHQIAQKRSLTGNDAWNGRKIQEAVAAYYGASFPVPNVNMGIAGYLEPGVDASLPGYARAEPVGNAANWPIGLHASRGLKDLPSEARIDIMRRIRDEGLEPNSDFFKTFGKSRRLERWIAQREQTKNLETLDLVRKLNIYPDLPNFGIPLTEYGFSESPDSELILNTFPRLLTDPLEAQAALAYLLIKNRVSTTVTISPSFSVLLDTSAGGGLINPPLAFDFCHQNHRAGQAVMWDRILGIADRLVDLLRGVEYAAGESFWDRSMIYFATEFGRTRRRAAGATDFGTSHDLNNGYAVLSPLVKGNTVLGGVDAATGLTYGFDPSSGAPDPGRTMTEREVYAGLVQALGVDAEGSDLPDMPAMRR